MANQLLTVKEWRDELNINDEIAGEITRFVAGLNAQAHMGQLAPALPDLQDRVRSALNNALGIYPREELIICSVSRYFDTLQPRVVYRGSGGNLKYDIEGCQGISNLFLFIDSAFSLEQMGTFRHLFEESAGYRITTTMKLALHPAFDQKMINMIIAGFETTVEEYVGLLLINAKEKAAAVFPLIDLFCSGNWPACYFPEQKSFLVLVA